MIRCDGSVDPARAPLRAGGQTALSGRFGLLFGQMTGRGESPLKGFLSDVVGGGIPAVFRP